MSLKEQSERDRPKVKLLDWRILPLAAVTGVVLFVLASKVADLESFGDTVRDAKPAWIVAAAAILFAQLLLAVFRMNLSIASMGYKIPFARGFDAVMATWPLALITPSRASDVLRAWILRDLCPPAEGSGAIIVEKMVDVQSLCLLGMAGGFVTGIWQASAAAALLLAAEWVFVFGVILNGFYAKLPVLNKRSEKIGRVLRVFTAFQERPRYFFGVAATSLLAWSMAVGILACLGQAFSADFNYVSGLALWPLSIFVGMLPLTVAGMGTRDAAFIALLGVAQGNVNEAGVLATTMAYSLISAWLLALLGIPWMLKHFASWFKGE